MMLRVKIKTFLNSLQCLKILIIIIIYLTINLGAINGSITKNSFVTVKSLV